MADFPARRGNDLGAGPAPRGASGSSGAVPAGTFRAGTAGNANRRVHYARSGAARRAEPRAKGGDLRLRDNPQGKRHRVLIVGSGDVGQTLAQCLEATGQVYSSLDLPMTRRTPIRCPRWPILGHRSETAQLALEFLSR